MHLRRNLALYFAAVVPVCVLTGAAMSATAGGPRSGGFWDQLSGWLVFGWVLPWLFLPAALVVVAAGTRLPASWPPAGRRAALAAGAAVCFVAEVIALAVSAQWGGFALPAAAVAAGAGLLYGAIVRVSPRPAA